MKYLCPAVTGKWTSPSVEPCASLLASSTFHVQPRNAQSWSEAGLVSHGSAAERALSKPLPLVLNRAQPLVVAFHVYQTGSSANWNEGQPAPRLLPVVVPVSPLSAIGVPPVQLEGGFQLRSRLPRSSWLHAASTAM